MKRAKIVGIGAYAPQRVLTNSELEKLIDTSDEWIVQRTGIRERRIVDDDEGARGSRPPRGAPGARAGRCHAGGDRPHRRRHDRRRHARSRPPAMSCSTASAAGTRARWTCYAGVFRVDLQPERGRAVHPDGQVPDRALRRRGVSVAHHRLHRPRHVHPPRGCRGRRRAARHPTARRASSTPTSTRTAATGELLMQPAGGARYPATHETVDKGMHYAKMKGNEVFKVAVRMFGDAAQRILERNGFKPTDLDLFVPHQANLRIIEAAVKRLGLPMERVIVNVERYGNTGRRVRLRRARRGVGDEAAARGRPRAPRRVRRRLHLGRGASPLVGPPPDATMKHRISVSRAGLAVRRHGRARSPMRRRPPPPSGSEADDALGFSLSRLCREGPEVELAPHRQHPARRPDGHRRRRRRARGARRRARSRGRSQPRRVLRARDRGRLSFRDAVRLVRKRGAVHAGGRARRHGRDGRAHGRRRWPPPRPPAPRRRTARSSAWRTSTRRGRSSSRATAPRSSER